MSAGAINVEACCYGFLGALQPPRVAPSGWWHEVAQRPFRGDRLWLWGDPNAELTSLRIGIDEQLAMPVRFAWFAPVISIEQFASHVERAPEKPRGAAQRNLIGALISTELQALNEHMQTVLLRTASPGVPIRFEFRGDVQGIALVGVQAL